MTNIWENPQEELLQKIENVHNTTGVPKEMILKIFKINHDVVMKAWNGGIDTHNIDSEFIGIDKDTVELVLKTSYELYLKEIEEALK